MIPKVKAYRSDKYLAFVRTLPCNLCYTDQNTVAHHIIGVGGQMSGMGLKAPDNYSMSLCPTCHFRIHQEPELWERQWQWVAKTQALWIEDDQH